MNQGLLLDPVELEPNGPPTDPTDPVDGLRLLSRAFHRSRNLLMSMRGYAELIQRAEAPARHDEWAGKIVRQLDRLGDLYSRIESISEAVESRPQAVPVAWLARAAVRVSEERLHDGHTATVRSHLEADASMDGNSTDLVQALAALVDNALEASPSGAVVDVELHGRLHGGWVLEILDEGSGIPDTLLERIHEPFFTRKSGHLGLGLYLSQTILKRHGCVLHVENRPGGGARCVVSSRQDARGGKDR